MIGPQDRVPDGNQKINAAVSATGTLLTSMSKFLFGLILGIVLLLVVEYLFVAHGGLYMGTKR